MTQSEDLLERLELAAQSLDSLYAMGLDGTIHVELPGCLKMDVRRMADGGFYIYGDFWPQYKPEPEAVDADTDDIS